MFSVSCLGSTSGSTKSLARGVCFGFGEQPIKFEVRSELIDVPLYLRFFLRNDPSRPSISFVVGDIEDGNRIDVVFYNVGDGKNAGLIKPSDIIKIKDSSLSMHFRIDRAFQADSYSLIYEFFETKVLEVSNE
ncbi:DUF6864 domain-containing function [Pseudomonas syringae]|uniref:DUF6864 domain-containing function n=1 Tax=Pseudomonas syringae TaxID=317 RepID=UPI003F74B24F